MLFWICLIMGCGFGWWGLNRGFYTWAAALFNWITALYISVLSTPVILSMSPEYEKSGYYAGATVFVLATGIFTVLQLFAYFNLLRDAEEYFPKLIDQLAGAVCGFLFGYFVLGIILFVISVMPFSRMSIPSFLPQRDRLVDFGRGSVIRACNFIGSYSLECFDGEPEAVSDYLLKLEEPVLTPVKEKPKSGDVFKN